MYVIRLVRRTRQYQITKLSWHFIEFPSFLPLFIYLDLTNGNPEKYKTDVCSGWWPEAVPGDRCDPCFKRLVPKVSLVFRFSLCFHSSIYVYHYTNFLASLWIHSCVFLIYKFSFVFLMLVCATKPWIRLIESNALVGRFQRKKEKGLRAIEGVAGLKVLLLIFVLKVRVFYWIN